MLGKLIAFGDDRATAIARMKNALDEILIEGIQSNIPLHQSLLADEAFQKGGLSIHYLEEKLGMVTNNA